MIRTKSHEPCNAPLPILVWCACPLQFSTFSKDLAPFPNVDTDSRLSPNVHYRAQSFNATITTFTSFDAYLDFLPIAYLNGSRRLPRPCLLQVTHAPAGTGFGRGLRSAICTKWNSTPPAERREEESWCDPGGRRPSRVRLDSLNAWSLYNLTA
jgi:hypothetical protein